MLRYKVRVRKGKWADSPHNPERRKPRKREEKPKHESRVTDVSGSLRRSMAEEIGETELSKERRFAMLQKYGIVAPKIDRKVVRPSWKSEKQWNQELNEWYRATKGMIPAAQMSTRPRQSAKERLSSPKLRTRPWREIHHKKYNGPKPNSPQQK